ncbi:MAG: 2-C-methyl-D-erythritol 2,4-cyclodiphosphate synthase [Pseudomonadales bacterium]|nr:2-C-methyl-D-erythritol 2,4-cyclodiphosphate synthase [Pseudomonadales bacterium]
MKIGNGYDVHRFGPKAADACITIGGVRIAHECPLLAHSDGDVLIHALCDALLGALALGDIGQHFPDSDPRYRGISSVLLLHQVQRLVRERGYRLGNTDLTLVAQAPKFAPHIDAIRKTLAQALDTSVERVSVKATTTEGLGFTGRREGIACYAVVLLERT